MGMHAADLLSFLGGSFFLSRLCVPLASSNSMADANFLSNLGTKGSAWNL